MKKVILGSVASLIAATSVGTAGAMAPREIAPARDGNIAIHEELCAARAKASVKAYDLFIARHPKHPLAATAKAERARLRKSGRKPKAGDC